MNNASPFAARPVRIGRLGLRGEGIAQTPDGPLYVSYALPGELVSVYVEGERGALEQVIEPSVDRIAPFCVHYAQCGGCAVQALAEPAYLAWKTGLVEAALANAGIETKVAPIIDAHGEGRRRAAFHARVQADALGRYSVVTGFMRARSHDIVQIDNCPILAPALQNAPAVAHAIARAMAGLGKPLDIWVTALDDGLDVDVHGSGEPPEEMRRALVDLAGRLELVRLSIHGTTLIVTRPPRLTIGPALVEPPPGAFLQATRAGEEALAALVLERIGKARRVADLYAGVGTFTHPLAQRAQVHAVEYAQASVDALQRAANLTPGAKSVTSQARDLARRPLDADELAEFDAVVFDPPRAGAEAQARELAKSKVPRVIAVSCNVQTFARDARILLDGGFELDGVAPVDQFRHSPHVELVAAFSRPKPAKPRRRLLG